MNCCSDFCSSFFGFFFLVLVAFEAALPFGVAVAAFGWSAIGLGLSTARAGSASANALAAIRAYSLIEDVMIPS
jgi:hypothetical protein